MDKILVTGVGDSLGTATIRSIFEGLDKNKFQLFTADANRYASGLYNKMISDSIVLPLANDDNYINSVINYCIKKQITFFIPCSEDEIIKVVNNIEIFNQNNIKTLLPSKDVLSIAADKALSCELIEKLKIPYPKTFIIQKNTKRVDVDNFIKELNYPIIAKPARAQGAKGIYHIYNEDELSSFLVDLKENFIKYLIQEFIPGKKGSMYAFGSVSDLNSEIKTEFVSRSLQTRYEFGGPATVGESVYNNIVVQRSKEIISALGDWRGPIMIEFILDPRDNEFKFIEINPRLWGYSYLSTASGVNIPKKIVQILKGEEIEYQKDYKEGVILIREQSDIITNSLL